MNVLGSLVAAAIIGLAGWLFRHWLSDRLRAFIAFLYRKTNPPGDSASAVPSPDITLSELTDQVRINLRANKPLLVAEISGVTTVHIWIVINNFSLQALRVVKCDIHFQIGNFLLKKSGIGIGTKIEPQRPRELSAEITLNDPQTRLLRTCVPDNLLRDRAIVNISCHLESRIGEISKDEVFERSNEFIGMSLPATPLRIVAPAFKNRYTPGIVHNKRCYFLDIQMVITNLADRPIRIVKVGLAEFPQRAPAVITSSEGDELRPQEIADVRALIAVEPPVKYGEDIVATLVVIDNLDNEHRISGWRFSSSGPDLPEDSTQVPGPTAS